MWWKTGGSGDKIVAIESSDTSASPPPYIRKGEVYTVDYIYIAPNLRPMVQTVENPLYETHDYYAGWDCNSFRPVDPASKKADRVLASLKPSLLNPIPIRKHETVGGE